MRMKQKVNDKCAYVYQKAHISEAIRRQKIEFSFFSFSWVTIKYNNSFNMYSHRSRFSLPTFCFLYYAFPSLECLLYVFLATLGVCLVSFGLCSGLQLTSFYSGKGNAKVLRKNHGSVPMRHPLVRRSVLATCVNLVFYPLLLFDLLCAVICRYFQFGYSSWYPSRPFCTHTHTHAFITAKAPACLPICR